ncbi:cell division protein FtsQ/DivIB [Saccharomonospora xinjiangensis]|uniref:cell division protein FtsQ/DivIB n=1 Tax=Saccharomonospora xinjiangensis TaxID=75294 RepID=UPI00351021BD
MATRTQRAARRGTGRERAKGRRGKATAPSRRRTAQRGKDAPSRRRTAQRGKAAPSRRRTAQRRRIALLSAVTVVALGYLVWFTPFLGVSTVEVVGVRTVSHAAVRSAAAVPVDHPLLRVNTDEVAARVGRLPGVATVDVARSWPSTLTITVTERRAIAYHEGGDGIRLVDVAGVPYKRVARPPEGLPRLEIPDPGPGDGPTRAVTGVLASLPSGLSGEVVAARATTPGDVELDLTGDRVVRWGDAHQNAEKARVLAVLLTREATTYDVSSPELPTVS